MAKKKKMRMSKSPDQGEPVAVADDFDDGPEVSPYTSPICSVYFNSGEPFMVPRDIICVSAELNRICSSSSQIDIQDVPAEAGHVLVHYLHTRTWQSLRKMYYGHNSRISTQFETSVYVYAAAQRYGLGGLVELAKENISRYTNEMPPLDIIVLAAKPSDLLSDDDSWFFAFIKTHIQQMFEDPASLNESVFLDCFNGAAKYSRVLAKSMFLMCCQKAASVESAETHAVSVIDETPFMDSFPSTPNLVPEPEPEPEPVAPLDPPPEPEPPNEPAPELAYEDPVMEAPYIECEAVPWEPVADAGVEITAPPEDAPAEKQAVEVVPDEMSMSMKPDKKSKKKSKKSKKDKHCSSCRALVSD
ncbi:hypothetical protein LZ32DRAFT_593743 [Colletotrichum eremochloae]|nr:hypothetical protein LZ32DRAFT_593743 [Colletotrichum eremochloae]